MSLIATNTATDGLTAGRFANDRHFNGQGGGQSLAEVAVFEDILTPAERDAVESYLTDKWFRGPDLRILEIAGTGSVGRADSGTLRVNVLTGTGQVLAEGAVEADTVKLAGALDLAGEGAYAVGLLRGAGTLTASAPILLEHVGLYREALTLAAPLAETSIDTVYGQGALTLDGGIGFSNVRVGDAIAVTNDGTALAVGWLSGQGTFNSSGCGAFTIDTLALGGTVTFNNGSSPLAIASMTGNGRLVATGSPTTLDQVALADLQSAAGGVTQWWDVRKGAFADEWMYAYSENEASAPQVLPASANGLPIVSFGPYQSGHYLRWSKAVQPVRTFFMAIGTHEGGGYLLGYSLANDFHRNSTGGGSYRTALWNPEHAFLNYSRNYVDGESFAATTPVPFNGGYQVLTFIDDTDESLNPTLKRGRPSLRTTRATTPCAVSATATSATRTAAKSFTTCAPIRMNGPTCAEIPRMPRRSPSTGAGCPCATRPTRPAAPTAS